LTDEDVKRIAACPRLAGLCWLDLSHNFTIDEAGVEAIAASPYLRRLKSLGLSLCRCDPREFFDVELYTGFVQAIHFPELGRTLERRYGNLIWLHPDSVRGSRFELARENRT
jgi:hypothetical protein